MTVHSGIFGPVHTGILSDIELFGALRLQRRLDPCSTTSATGLSRCVETPCGTTAPPKSGASCSRRVSTASLGSSRLPLRRALCLSRFVMVFLFRGRGLGLPVAIFAPFCAFLGWHLHALWSPTCSGAWIPGGGNEAPRRSQKQGVPVRYLWSHRRAAAPQQQPLFYLGVHPERKRHGTGCDPCSTPSQEGLADTRR